MRKNCFLSGALVAFAGLGLVGCSDNPDRITNVNEVVKELVDFGGYVFYDKNGNGSVDSGEGLSGAYVRVHDPIQDKTVEAKTDANGRFNYSQPFAEGAYNVTFSSSALSSSSDSSVGNGNLLVNGVTYFHAEAAVGLVQTGDGADGTPERGAVTANFSAIAGPVMTSTSLGNLTAAADAFDLLGKTHIEFSFNKSISLVNDPQLRDTTTNEVIAWNSKTATTNPSSNASIKGASAVFPSSTTGNSGSTFKFGLPDLTSRTGHTFTLTWARQDYKAVDNGQFGQAAPAGLIVDSAGAGVPADASAAAQAGAIALAGWMDPAITAAGLSGGRAGNSKDIITSSNKCTIVSVSDNANNSPFAVFAPKARFDSTSLTVAGSRVNPTVGAADTVGEQANSAGGNSVPATFADGRMTQAYKVQISNVKSDLHYIPVVSYDGGTTWYYAAGAWVAGNTANNGNLTLITGNVDHLAAGLPRPYYLVKSFYNATGNGYTLLKIAMRAKLLVAGAETTAFTDTGVAVGVPVRGLGADAPSDYSANGIDGNVANTVTTAVSLFDGDLTNSRNRGFNRVAGPYTNAAAGTVTNGMPFPQGPTAAGVASDYQDSSYPFPLHTAAVANEGFRSGWFNLVEDGAIKTDLVEVDGDALNSNTQVAGPDLAGNDHVLVAADQVIGGFEEAASATVNANDNPNPALGSKNTIFYCYFNEPMDKATVEGTSNWRARAITAASVPSVSKVEYAESINTQTGLEVFRAKVTLSGALLAGSVIEYGMGALVDKNGNYPVTSDGQKPTGYVQVHFSN